MNPQSLKLFPLDACYINIHSLRKLDDNVSFGRIGYVEIEICWGQAGPDLSLNPVSRGGTTIQ